MNSAERLLACLTGKLPDRVPISTYELVGWNDSAWENREPSYRGLMDFIRARTDCLYMTGVEVPNLADERATRVERWDQGREHWTRTTLQSAGRTLTREASWVDDVKTVWTRKHWCADLDDLEAMLARPVELGEPDFGPLRKAWRELDNSRGLPLVSVADALCEVSELFEFGQFTILAMTETDAIVRALDAVHEVRLEMLRRALRGPVRNTVWRICGPEYATPPYLPPELFRRFVTPYVKQYVEMIHAAGAFARIHIHGRIGRILDQIAEIAPAAIDPVEPPPDGDATVAQVKSAIGNRVCLMGGIELKHLEAGSEAFVEQITRDIMAEGKPGGRFVIMPTAAPINIPLSPQTERNYFRYIETALEHGTY